MEYGGAMFLNRLLRVKGNAKMFLMQHRKLYKYDPDFKCIYGRRVSNVYIKMFNGWNLI